MRPKCKAPGSGCQAVHRLPHVARDTWHLVHRTPHLARDTQRGSSLAWTAVLLSVVLVPLLTLVLDGARLYTIRTRLQTAVDAACEDAAWSAASRRIYTASNADTLDDNWYVIAVAQNTFHQTLGESGAMRFSASAVISPDYAHARVTCTAAAFVPLVTAGGLVYSPVTIEVVSASRIRFFDAAAP